MDIKSKEARSINMSKIKSQDTKPEIYIRRLFFRNGIRFRKNYNGVPGKPDLYISKYKTAVFVHGCFWHRHLGCKYSYMPKTDILKWTQKFENNIRRDESVLKQLNDEGYKVMIIWECTVKKMIKNDDFCKEVLECALKYFENGSRSFIEI